MISTDIGVWVGVMVIFMTLSFLFKPKNPLFTLMEHTAVALTLGYTVVASVKVIIKVGWIPLMNGNFNLIPALIVSLLLYTSVSKKYGSISRWANAFLIGIGVALTIRGTIGADLHSQILSTMKLPLFSGDIVTNLNNTLLILMLLGTLSYFYFTRKSGKYVDGFSKFGRYSMMLAFGAAFGNSALGRVSLLINVIKHILFTWLGL